MNYTKARNNPTSFLALTSVSISLFDEILPFFTDTHDEFFRWHDVKGKKLARRRSHVIQSNSPLPTVADRLFFIHVYLKNNPTQEYHAAWFDMSQQQCGQWIHTLTEVLREAVSEAGMLPASDMASFKRILDERGGDAVVHNLIHDGTEREIPRPSDTELQKEYYSGKKKKHTVKNAVITCLAGFILFSNLTVEGKISQPNRRRPIPRSRVPASKWNMPLAVSRFFGLQRMSVDCARMTSSAKFSILPPDFTTGDSWHVRNI